MPGQVDTVGTLGPVDVALLEARSEVEDQLQRDILFARKYHAGEQMTQLTDRIRQFLPSVTEGKKEFRLNICRVIVSAMTDRMRVVGFDSVDKNKIAWAAEVWDENKGPVVELDLYETIFRDGEAFVVIDSDQETGTIFWHVNQRFTSLDVGGDGTGCRAYYENDDPNQRLVAITKEWTNLDGRGRTNRFRNIYYPDKILKQKHNGNRWVTYDDVNWVDAEGKPLGIAAVHFYNKGFKREAEDAYTPQDAINKTFLDLLASSDLAAFRIFVALGWIPTTDGKAPEEDMSNWMPIEPGRLIGTDKPRSEVDLKVVEGGDFTSIMNLVQQNIMWASMVTNTPVSRFIATKLIASDETLKQQEEPLVAKIEGAKTLIAYSWRKVFELTEKIWAVFNTEQPTDKKVKPIWCHSASQESLMAILIQKQTLGIPEKQLWREMGYDESKITQMESEKQAALDAIAKRMNQNQNQNLNQGQGGSDASNNQKDQTN